MLDTISKLENLVNMYISLENVNMRLNYLDIEKIHTIIKNDFGDSFNACLFSKMVIDRIFNKLSSENFRAKSNVEGMQKLGEVFVVLFTFNDKYEEAKPFFFDYLKLKKSYSTSHKQNISLDPFFHQIHAYYNLEDTKDIVNNFYRLSKNDFHLNLKNIFDVAQDLRIQLLEKSSSSILANRATNSSQVVPTQPSI